MSLPWNSLAQAAFIFPGVPTLGASKTQLLRKPAQQYCMPPHGHYLGCLVLKAAASPSLLLGKGPWVRGPHSLLSCRITWAQKCALWKPHGHTHINMLSSHSAYFCPQWKKTDSAPGSSCGHPPPQRGGLPSLLPLRMRLPPPGEVLRERFPGSSKLCAQEILAPECGPHCLPVTWHSWWQQILLRKSGSGSLPAGHAGGKPGQGNLLPAPVSGPFLSRGSRK